MSQFDPRPHPMDIPGGAPNGVNVADIAVELRLAELELPQLSYATLLEAMVRHQKSRGLEELAARIGIDREVARRIVHDANRRIDLIGAAHLTFKALIPHEAELHRLLIADPEWSAKFRRVG